MFVKITRSAGRQYVKLVEAFRDDRGVPCQRVIATLGRLEVVRAGDSNALIDGLLRLRLKDHGSPHSPERALEISRRIQHHQVSLQQRPSAAGITNLSPEQQELFAALGLPPPIAAAL